MTHDIFRETLDQFLARLVTTTRLWVLLPTGEVRLGNHVLATCPLEAVYGTVAHQAPLSRQDCEAVMRAADFGHNFDPALRAQLLQRTGLAKPEVKA